MFCLSELEKKVKSGLFCHIRLNCNECPYSGIDCDCLDDLALPCATQLCHDAVRLFEHYAEAFASLDAMYCKCKEEKDQLEEKNIKLLRELDFISTALAYEIAKSSFLKKMSKGNED